MNIYYFTGTGNSIAICRELQKHFEDAELRSIASFAGRTEIGDDSDVVVSWFLHTIWTFPR